MFSHKNYNFKFLASGHKKRSGKFLTSSLKPEAKYKVENFRSLSLSALPRQCCALAAPLHATTTGVAAVAIPSS
ncbi:hypothetical protein OUZ56_010468 [Daphnia magna]|uniref:Uncharacterized protein n=1 Tax=Daphnia magna TaxID=35525 RepID=A0ABR0AIP4_9CRUS|nr:hypothetical protein OUZ56_010468 [Daphnia magna]